MKSLWRLNAPELIGTCITSAFAGYFLGKTIENFTADRFSLKDPALFLIFSILVCLITIRNRGTKDTA